MPQPVSDQVLRPESYRLLYRVTNLAIDRDLVKDFFQNLGNQYLCSQICVFMLTPQGQFVRRQRGTKHMPSGMSTKALDTYNFRMAQIPQLRSNPLPRTFALTFTKRNPRLRLHECQGLFSGVDRTDKLFQETNSFTVGSDHFLHRRGFSRTYP